jgi:hypothetical protein
MGQRRDTYKNVIASQTASTLGVTGNKDDFLSHVLIVPGTTSPGAVTLVDGAVSSVIFAGGASSVPDLKPFLVPVLANASTGPWQITTGANVSAFVVGSVSD